jgi:hypothetical protein
MSHALIIRGHGAGLSRPGCEPRALIGRILFRCAQPRTRDLFSNPSAPRAKIARAPACDPCERVLAPPDRTHPVEVGFDDLWQMTSVMGSSPAHCYARRSSPAGSRGRDRQARASLGLAALPLPVFCFFTGGYLVSPGTIGARSRSTGPVVLTDAFFGLDDRSARAICTRFRPLTRLFGANDQRHGVEHRP